MTKYSYKTSEFKSSVVVLKDGRAMEVRRGEKTTFAKGERQLWASLEDWKTTLPVGAEVTGSAPKRNALVDRIVKHGQQRSMLSCRGTYMETLQQRKAFLLKYQELTPTSSKLAKDIEEIDNAMTSMAADGTGDKLVYVRTARRPRYFVQTADGMFSAVFYSKKLGVAGYYEHDTPSMYIGGAYLGYKFVEITDNDIPLWFRRHDDLSMVRI